jgi:hypothetical protein
LKPERRQDQAAIQSAIDGFICHALGPVENQSWGAPVVVISPFRICAVLCNDVLVSRAGVQAAGGQQRYTSRTASHAPLRYTSLAGEGERPTVAPVASNPFDHATKRQILVWQ